MIEHENTIRPRYGETDQIDYLYDGIYALYYEVGRVEALRSLGLYYRALESEYGISMPVPELSSRYLRLTRYDDLIRVMTYLRRIPGQTNTFYSALFDEQDRLINKGIVSLAFIRAQDDKRIGLPEILDTKPSPYFE